MKFYRLFLPTYKTYSKFYKICNLINPCGRKWLKSDLRYSSYFRLKRLRKIAKILRTVGIEAQILTRDIPNKKLDCELHCNDVS
jgi:hypothetical protein